VEKHNGSLPVVRNVYIGAERQWFFCWTVFAGLLLFCEKSVPERWGGSLCVPFGNSDFECLSLTRVFRVGVVEV
jgi:hypothetical protein